MKDSQSDTGYTHNSNGYWVEINGWEFPTKKNKLRSNYGNAYHTCWKGMDSTRIAAIASKEKVNKDNRICRICSEKIPDQILFIGLMQRL